MKTFYLIMLMAVINFYPLDISANTIIPYYDTYIISQESYPKEIFKNFTTLETPRLILRKVQPQDKQDIFTITSDRSVVRYTSTLEFTKSMEDVELLINIMTERYDKDLPTRWVIFHKEDKKVIGICGFYDYVPMYARAELGYALSRSYWGKGVGTEAAQAVVDFGFKNMNLNRIEATCDPENRPSSHILEKIGMKYEGILRQHIFKDGKYCDRKMYAMLRSDWSEQKAYD